MRLLFVVVIALAVTACAGGAGVDGEAYQPSTVATAPPGSGGTPGTDLCGLLDRVATDADRIDESAPPAALAASMQGVAAFRTHGPAVAPPEVEAEVSIVARLYDVLIDGLEANEWDWAAFTASDAALRVADLRADPATAAALERVSDWSRRNCIGPAAIGS